MVSALAWALLDYASQHKDRGCVEGFDVETYAAFSGFDESVVESIIAALSDKGMIDQDDRWASWEKRQPEREDSSTERVRRYRESRNGTGVTPEDVTHGNAVKRNATHGNAPDTDTDTDTEKRGSATVSVKEGGAKAKRERAAKPPPPTEIETIRKVTGRYPDKVLWESIVAAISGKSEDDIRAAYTAWIGRGFNRTNYAWALEWVPNGIPSAPGKAGKATPPNGLPAPEMVWAVVQAEIDRAHYYGTPSLPAPIMAAVEAVGGWYTVAKCDPAGSIPARLRDAYRHQLGG
jgi:hypothetical protein